MTRTAVVPSMLLLATLAVPSAFAADLRVRYLMEERALRSVDAASTVAIALFTDAACTSQAFTTTLALRDVDLLARVATTTVRGAPKAVKAAELAHTLANVPAVAPLYARVTGEGVVALGGACQVQTVAVPAQNVPVLVDGAGTVLGPYGVGADRGYPVWLRPFGTLTYAVYVEWGELRGTDYALYYEATDCSSTPLIYADFYSQLLFFPSVTRGDTLYSPVAPPSQRVVRASSYEAETPGECPGSFVSPHHCCQTFSGGQTFAGEYLETGTSDLGGYVPPFHVELR